GTDPLGCHDAHVDFSQRRHLTERRFRDRVMRTTTARSLVTGTLGLAVTIATVVTSRGLAGQGTPTLVEGALQRDFPTIVDTSITLVGTLLALLAFGRFRRSRR